MGDISAIKTIERYYASKPAPDQIVKNTARLWTRAQILPFLGGFTIVFAALSLIGSTVYFFWDIGKPEREWLKSVIALNQESLTLESRLQQQDTDQDGLSDYSELSIFGTSPYVADTDSDGQSDQVEIDAGTNPLCAGVGECAPGQIILPPDSTDQAPTTSLNPAAGMELSGNQLEQLKTIADMIETDPTNEVAIAAQARALLISIGLDAQELAAIPDHDMVVVFQENLILLQQQLEAGSAVLPTADGGLTGVPNEDVPLDTNTATY